MQRLVGAVGNVVRSDEGFGFTFYVGSDESKFTFEEITDSHAIFRVMKPLKSHREPTQIWAPLHSLAVRIFLQEDETTSD